MLALEPCVSMPSAFFLVELLLAFVVFLDMMLNSRINGHSRKSRERSCFPHSGSKPYLYSHLVKEPCSLTPFWAFLYFSGLDNDALGNIFELWIPVSTDISGLNVKLASSSHHVFSQCPFHSHHFKYFPFFLAVFFVSHQV